jgi:hypothetical protein
MAKIVQGRTIAHSKDELSLVARELGRRGGLAAARNMTPEQRQERARRGAVARAQARKVVARV